MKIILFVAALLFTLLLGLPIARGIQSHCFSAFDLGIYARALEAISLSDLNPWISVRGVRIFFDHFDPIIIPPAFLTPLIDPRYLLVGFEWLAAILCALSFAYAYQKRLLSMHWSAFAIFAVLFSQAMTMAFHYPGHPSTWSLGLLSWACFFLRAAEFKKAMLLFLLGCLFKEEYAVYSAVIAFYLAIKYPRLRFFSIVSFLLSCCWFVFVFVIRPRLADVYVGYEDSLLSGLRQFERLANFYGDSGHLKTLLLMFGPLFLLPCFTKRWKSEQYILLLLFLIMIAVRLFGLWWFPHRSAQVFIVGLWALLPSMDQPDLAKGRTRAFLAYSWLALLIAINPVLRHIKVAGGAPYRKMCPAAPERINSINMAVAELLLHQNEVVAAQSHLIPALFAHPQAIMIEADSYLKARYLLIEKPPFGDPWPRSEEEHETLLQNLSQSPDWEAIRSDNWILLLRKR